jgi:hypothetical protein
MNGLAPLTRARAYRRDLIKGRWGDWWGYSKSHDVRTAQKESSHKSTNECIHQGLSKHTCILAHM